MVYFGFVLFAVLLGFILWKLVSSWSNGVQNGERLEYNSEISETEG
jgi:hypothetical protein